MRCQTKYDDLFAKQLESNPPENTHSFFGYSLTWEDAYLFKDISVESSILPSESYRFHHFWFGNLVYFPESPSNKTLYYVETTMDRSIEIREITKYRSEGSRYILKYNPILDRTKPGLYESLTDDEPVIEGAISIAPLSDYYIASKIGDSARFVKKMI